MDNLDEIAKAKRLLDDGVITQEEFGDVKARRLKADQQVGRIYTKSKIAAGLFALFLGSLGIHKFYLGYIGTGVLLLILTLISCAFLAAGFPIPLLIIDTICLIEGIIYLTRDPEKFDETYVQGTKHWF